MKLEPLNACLAWVPDAQVHGAFVVVDEDGARRAAAACRADRCTVSPSPSRI
jgi:hypothetical protein